MYGGVYVGICLHTSGSGKELYCLSDMASGLYRNFYRMYSQLEEREKAYMYMYRTLPLRALLIWLECDLMKTSLKSLRIEKQNSTL